MPTFDISDDVVSGLGSSSVSATGPTVSSPDSLAWDCSVGGMNFLLANSDQYPFRRETAQFRRDRVDTERNPGEQSLDSGFWLRSQASWHYGSGLSSAEPLEVSDTEASFRYYSGGGVNPWTPGEVSLLNDTSLVQASTGSDQYLIGVGTGVLHADGTTVRYITNAGSASSVTWGGSVNPVTSLTSDGVNYYATNSTGIYKGTLPSGTGSLAWNTGSAALSRWVKSRLMAAVGASLYELTGTGPTLPTALFTHPSSGWVWTDFSEGPTSIYVSGYAGDQSLIYRISVDTTTSAVTLSQPSVVSDLPRGEVVYSLYSYVGSYLVVGTSKGVRIALINGDGSLSLGPLIVESSDGCKDAVAVGSYIYATVGTKGEAGNRVQRAGLYRIDLSSNLNNNPLLFPSAPDLVCASGVAGAAHQVTVSGDRLWFTVTGTGGGVFKQQDTYVTEGWLETGRIRLGTVEPKSWRSLRLLMKEGTQGSVTGFAAVSDSLSPSNWTEIVSIPSGYYDVSGSLNTVAPVPLSSLYVAIRLQRATSTTAPSLTGWQVRAVPAPDRSELVQVPVLLFDYETDRKGARWGAPGGAWSRFSAIKAIEQDRSTVTWMDYTTGERAEAFVEQVSLSRTAPPSKAFSGSGGVMTILLRLV